MTELLTAAQMRAIEAAAITSGEVTGLELMERAGRGVVAATFEEWPELAEGGHRAVVLCGPGNNGGDGFVVARLLKEAGWDVEVFLYGDAEKLPPDARVNYERWGELGEVAAIASCTSHRWVHQPIVIDALFGTGLARPLTEDLRNILMATMNCRRVAVDVPSMLSSDTGVMMSPVFHSSAAHLTVTFHSRKLGHLLCDGPANCGEVRVVDIGLNHKPIEGAVELLTHTDNLSKRVGHKYSHGHALILCGSVGKGGAARLAARGALRVGAGAVTVGCPPAALIENAAQLNAVMLRKIKGADALTAALEDARINALCMGPGLGVSDESRSLIEAGLKSGRAIVLDADALTLIGRDAPLFAMLHDRCVLTPHAGEFARMFPDIAEKLAAPASKGPAYSKVDATRDAARRAGCTVLFKGPDTVIADPSVRCSINASVYERSAPWLATAGSGDVLAGFITGLLARGFAPMKAAETGAWLHTECALSFGPGLIAEDLPEELPKVFRALGL
ncbi:NAD(P)H-hydrate dehydratase [Yoonia sp.]|uniref:NAD(P)H-hydrate dehydratase n=1 Tax=Yoonia sp. TaxID=2212373 RepID=UPI002DFB70B0|nr:NAD(P)H-hydrate dehydratase [Yoonia sp.]